MLHKAASGVPVSFRGAEFQNFKTLAFGLVGSEFRLRILVGTRFVSQALPRSCKNDVIYTLSTKPHGFVLFLLVWILFFMDMLFCDTMPHGFGWDTYFHLTAYLL